MNSSDQQQMSDVFSLGTLDISENPAFDDLVKIACEIADCSAVGIGTFDRDRIRFKPFRGLSVTELETNRTIFQSLDPFAEISFFQTNESFLSSPRQITTHLCVLPISFQGTVPVGVLALMRNQVFTLSPSQTEALKSLAAIAIHLVRSKTAQNTLTRLGKLSILGELSSTIVHEINNPLLVISINAAQLAVSVAKENFSEKEVSIKRIEKITRMTDMIEKIVKSVKSLGRQSEQDPMELTALTKIIESTLDIYGEKLKKRKIELELQLENGLVVSCRPGELSQVILNLLVNSYDALEQVEKPWIKIKANKIGSKCQIRVSDAGKGIPESLQKKIMEPFFTTKPQGKGTGIGLSISKKIIEEHGGLFYYASDSANTCFVIELPLGNAKVRND